MTEGIEQVVSHHCAETHALGQIVGHALGAGYIILLSGSLGAGKSVFARGVAEALGVKNWSGSPTFTIVNEYRGTLPLYHMDLYRLNSDEVEDLGLEEYVRDDSLVMVEWAQRAPEFLETLSNRPAVRVHITIEGRDQRNVFIEGLPSGMFPLSSILDATAG